jgi:hypothetical protein
VRNDHAKQQGIKIGRSGADKRVGYYQSVDSGARYQVKRIVVKPGERLSYWRLASSIGSLATRIDRVSLGVHTGATPAQTGVGMSVTIYKQLKAKGAIDATGGASVGVGAEY